jgi:hypothetical protein
MTFVHDKQEHGLTAPNKLLHRLSSLTGAVVLVFAVWHNRFDPVLSRLVVHNFAAIVGLPSAFVASFIVIALFRQGETQSSLTALDSS